VGIGQRARSSLRPLVWSVRRRTLGRSKIRRAVAEARQAGEPVRVVVGGHWHALDGWLALDERDQDVTKPLAFDDGSVDAIFCEHVVEHIALADALRFFAEAHRVLRPDGILRVVVPTVEAMLDADLTTPEGQTYMGHTIAHHFSEAEAWVREHADESLVAAAPHVLFLNFMFYDHGHRFIWTRPLLVDALRWAGFTSARACEIGEGVDPEVCLERRRRGDYLGADPDADRAPGTVFNCDSGVAEAVR